jgi:CRP-like cAMP-binding protein
MTNVETLMAILSRYPFAEELRPSDLAKLCTMACEVPFRKNEIIFREGDECSTFYLLTAGRVILEIEVGGCPLGIETLEAGDELGWSSMLMRDRRHFQARALEPSHALAFDGAELNRACKEDPAFGYALLYRLLGVVARRLQLTRMRLVEPDGMGPPANRPGGSLPGTPR